MDAMDKDPLPALSLIWIYLCLQLLLQSINVHDDIFWGCPHMVVSSVLMSLAA